MKKIQQTRFTSNVIYCNAQMTTKQLKSYCQINEAGHRLLKTAMERLHLSARAYDRILKVSRTIADLADSENLEITPLAQPNITIAETAKNTVISRSRKKYGTPKQEVETALMASHGIPVEPELKEEKPAQPKVAEPTKQPINIEQLEPLTEVQETTTKESLVKQHEQTQHRYLQTLIKRMAESRGYKATIEEPTPDGKGRVDVSLERNNKKIAVEVSVTTTEDWEFHNIEKCLKAGYHTVIVCSNDKKILEKIEGQVEQKLNPYKSKILTLEPEGLFLYLDKEIAKDGSSEKLVKGYRVKVEYNAPPSNVAEQKKDNVMKTVSESMRKKGNKL